MRGQLAVSFAIPAWLADAGQPQAAMRDVQNRMAFVIDLSRRNVEAGGGPFAAAIFDMDTCELVASGVNLVVNQQSSMLHAEIVAIMRAQQRLATYDLTRGGRRMELVTSTEPCAMCFGAIPWAGLRRVVCAARDADARQLGFDEGAKVADWAEALRARGIEVMTDMRRDEAAAVLETYRQQRGAIYSPQPGP
jgi:tRNA(Arg) A34 adenosine deaminase TadA